MLLASLALAHPMLEYGVGDGSDGSLDIGPATAAEGPALGRLSVDVGTSDTALELQDASTFVAGDLVMLWQVTGLPEPAVGTAYPDIGDVGRYTLRRVTAINGTTFTLDAPVGSAYPAAHTQVVEVLEYVDLTVAGGTAAPVPPWDGSVGGILVALVSGRLDNQGLIDGSGRGYRGGASTDSNEYNCTAIDDNEAGQPGEALHGTSTRGFGHRGTAGGGGNCHNAGGAGGAHLGAGGEGGHANDNGSDVGGNGGVPLDPPSTLPERLFMGSGGGGAHINDGAPDGHDGGAVVVLIAADVDHWGTIDASGAGGGNADNDGGGGGGAGGTVVALSLTQADCTGLAATGGRGIDTDDFPFNNPHGPGGGGGGGLVYMSPAASGACPLSAAAGPGGLFDGSNPFGATAGDDGLVLVPAWTDLDVRSLVEVVRGAWWPRAR